MVPTGLPLAVIHIPNGSEGIERTSARAQPLEAQHYMSALSTSVSTVTFVTDTISVAVSQVHPVRSEDMRRTKVGTHPRPITHLAIDHS